MANQTATGSLIDPASLMRIKSIELRAKVVVEGFWHGIHRSPYHGFSVEFSEYRQYTHGDDPRFLDWKVYARSDRYFIKRFEDETNLRCHFVIDNSRSMGFGSLEYNKGTYAATLAATLARFLFLQGDAVGLTTFDEDVDDYIPARNRPGHLQRLMLALEKAPAGKGTDLTAPLRRVADLLRKRGLVLFLSDMLAPLDKVEEELGMLKAGGHEVVLMHVLDPAELEFDFEKATHFRDLETGAEFFIDPETARTDYLHRLDLHLAAIKGASGAHGMDYILVRTDAPLETVLYDFLSGRRHHKTAGNVRRKQNVRR